MSDLGVYLFDHLDQGIGETCAQVKASVIALRTQCIELGLEGSRDSDRNGAGRFGFLFENLHGRCSAFERGFCLQFANISEGRAGSLALLIWPGEGEVCGDHHVELVAGPYLDGRRSIHPAADALLSDCTELRRCAGSGLLSGHGEGTGLGVAVWPIGSATHRRPPSVQPADPR